MISNLIDATRILLVCAAFYFGYQIGYSEGYDPVAQLHFMIPVIITAIAGISGMEGLLMGEKAAEAKGYTADRNYQRQSALAMLSMTAVSVAVYFLHWGIRAELTILFVFLLFFLLSGINHLADAITRKNFAWQNINRPFITLLMIAGLAHPIWMALAGLQ